MNGSQFLEYSSSVGNDLSTPMPMYSFPGLKPGDQWCLCSLRWRQAYEAGVAPGLRLMATHEKTLEHTPLEVLMEYAVDAAEAREALENLDELRTNLEEQLRRDL